MTCVCWDGVTLAADKMTSFGMLKVSTTKLKRAASGEMMGFAGLSARGYELFAWYEHGAQRSEFPDSAGDSSLLVIKDGVAYCYEGGPSPITIESPFIAIGSGCDLAMAAMHLGQTAEQAVNIASIYNVHCGLGVDTMTYQAPKKQGKAKNGD